MKHARILFTVTALLSFVAAQAAPAPAPSTYGVLGGQWWLWALTTAETRDPVQDTTGKHCGVNQHHPVFFLAGTYLNGNKVSRTCTVPAGRPLFFPLINSRVIEETKADCEAGMRGVKPDMDAATGLRLSVDAQTTYAGKPPNATRGTMPCTYLPDFEVWLGSDGYWASVTFDKPGKHTIAWTGAMGGFRQNVSYALTVR